MNAALFLVVRPKRTFSPGFGLPSLLMLSEKILGELILRGPAVVMCWMSGLHL